MPRGLQAANKAMSEPRRPYQGKELGLVLAFDIGTTFSGVSYAFVKPGLPPECKSVTRFPGQASTGGDAKVPTVTYYNTAGQCMASGAETVMEANVQQAQEEGWSKAEWFKLRFRPEDDSQVLPALPPLPGNKNRVDVLSDFLRYLLRCAQLFIVDAHPNGSALWDSVKDAAIFVLTHPNGWHHEQQILIRRAAVQASLIPDESHDSQERLCFVTEGEASLHFCIQHGLRDYTVVEDSDPNCIVVVDAGGGTVDVSAYCVSSSVRGDGQPEFEEACVPQCHFTGSIVVSQRAKRYISTLLEGKGKFEDDIEEIVGVFDKIAKHSFSSSEQAAYVKFGGARDNDAKLGILRGQLKIPGAVVAGFFEPSIDSIIKSIHECRRTSPIPVTAVFLVGGFAASGYLYSRLSTYAQSQNIQFCRPDSHVNKAVAEGAISYFLDHFVSRRMAKTTYGLNAAVVYKANDRNHKLRAHTIRTYPSGLKKIPNQFSSLLTKGQVVSEVEEFRRPYIREVENIAQLKTVEIPLYSYFGNEKDPSWMDTDHAMYSPVHTIKVDLSTYARRLKPARGTMGKYYIAHFDVILLFGAPELKAQIAWSENGVERRSPAEIVITGR